MKQFPAPAKIFSLSLVIVFALCVNACSTATRNANARHLDAHSSPAPLHVNINTASAKEIEQLPGIGPVIAERIVSYREQHGPFKRREDLIMVDGISGKKYEEIRSMIVVE
jgi:competence protein ComEA